MRKELVRMNTVPREHDAELAIAALGAAPERGSVAPRRDEMIRRLRAAREALELEIAGVEAIEALRDDQWSVIHVLTHLGADGGGHFSPVYDMLERGVRELAPYEKREERFENARDAAFEEIDGAIAFAAGLSIDQLLMHARKGGQAHYVIGFLEATADHVDEHVAQLRAIKRHLAEARVRRQAVATG